jgi:DNA invertase Pin-like site-specific DNA recombinase
MDGRFVSYLRVSTVKQGVSGLGLEAQRRAVTDYLNGGRWKMLAEFVEVESGSTSNRPQLQAALDRCKLTGATLLVAKMDRLTRDLHFLTGLQLAGVAFTAVDNPQANEMTVQILASVAQAERKAISARTKAALAASPKKLGGWRGGPKSDGKMARAARAAKSAEFNTRVLPIASRLRAEGNSLRAIAAELTNMGVQTSRGGSWTAAAVNAVLASA